MAFVTGGALAVRLRDGDVLGIPIDAGLVALGQVVRRIHGNLLLSVFRETAAATQGPALDGVDLEKPALLFETMDLYARRGEWRVVGNLPVPDGLVLPVFKVPVGGEYRIHDVFGNIGRVATPEEAATLRNHRSYSPAMAEAAVRALNGREAWAAHFDDMRYQ
jgi:hypothetical protein